MGGGKVRLVAGMVLCWGDNWVTRAFFLQLRRGNSLQTNQNEILTKAARELVHDWCHHGDLDVVQELSSALPAVVGRPLRNALQPGVDSTEKTNTFCAASECTLQHEPRS